MKPLKVTMTAFGPYKDQETVNFTELSEHKLFVISGNTGAGKTTIFDAICFALYGDASGEDRNDVRMLRSDFADDDLHTSVELVFELKSKVYKVFRQLAHIKEGNKSATGDRYELYELIHGEEIPLTDRFIVSQINEKIQEIIGLTKEQFSQIVMLPQGEFRKLLTSETENKEEILRRIFKTGFYKNVGEQLNQQRKDVQKLYDEQLKVRDIYIEGLKSTIPIREESELFRVFSQDFYNTHQVLQALDLELSYYNQRLNDHSRKLQEKITTFQNFSIQFHEAKSINERFNQLDEKHKRKEALDVRAKEFEEKERKYELAEKASHLEVLEKHFIQLKDDSLKKQSELTTARNNYVLAEKVQIVAQTAYREEQQKESIRENTVVELERLTEYLPTVRELEQKRKQIETLTNTIQKMSLEANKLDALLQDKQSKKTMLNEQIKGLEENVRTLPEKTELISSLRNKAQVLKEYLKKLHLLQVENERAQSDQKVLMRVESEFDLLEASWIEGQASILATHLHNGQPCPVCGSVEHPKKAVLSNRTPTKEELEEKRKEKKLAEQAYNISKAKYTNTHEQIEELKQTVVDVGFDPIQAKKQYDHIVEQGVSLDKEIQQYKKEQLALDQLKNKYQEIEKQIEILIKELTDQNTLLSNTKATLQTEQSLFDQSIHKIPDELRSLQALQTSIEQLRHKKHQLDSDWKKAQTDFQTSNERLATAKANVENATIQVTDSDSKYEKAKQDYEASIKKAGFATEDSYKQSKMTTLEMDVLKSSIEEYKSDVKTVHVQILELEEELKARKRSDLDEMQSVLQTLEGELDQLRATSQEINNYITRSKEYKENIATTDNQLHEHEQKVQLVKDLYDAVRGENPKKISFERYLQIEFLEQIVQAANERLKQLSNGQYFLIRSDRLEKRGKQSGLGLDVLDHYTGQFRDVKSLSGGEKFNASLCLALGMADVIQAYEGGISIETMFIDEGFGSLDEESLNKAIDTLIDLQQSGRMIGVISHVAELKQAIPAILEVTKTKEGYSTTKFVIS
ncbi:AAA family ATPase [Bacillus salitolerans]|uniref:Nuclease SbcCD subunit C n=1 Tax=Bacillus salitolerans TaxID=1437434 RepID=A0ABW4LST1_9BACI